MSSPLTTTLAAIRSHTPCQQGWEKLLSSLGKTKADDEPLLFETILDSNGIDDALWCLRTLGPEHSKMCRLFAVWCARRGAERHANGEATDADLDVAMEANSCWEAAFESAMDAAWEASGDAEWAAAWEAARSAQAEKFRQICRAGEFVPDEVPQCQPA